MRIDRSQSKNTRKTVENQSKIDRKSHTCMRRKGIMRTFQHIVTYQIVRSPSVERKGSLPIPRENSSFEMQNSSFEIQNRSLQAQNPSFLAQNRGPKWLFTQPSPTNMPRQFMSRFPIGATVLLIAPMVVRCCWGIVSAFSAMKLGPCSIPEHPWSSWPKISSSSFLS